jgi:hypothetical protein
MKISISEQAIRELVKGALTPVKPNNEIDGVGFSDNQSPVKPTNNSKEETGLTIKKG